jgi:hypothetical protein
MNTIEFTRAKLAKLKEMYSHAKANKIEQFQFEGHPMLTAYAKYLIEYLEGRFKPDTATVHERPFICRDNGR